MSDRSPPSAVAEARAPFYGSRYTLACLTALAVLGAMAGFRNAYFPRPSLFDALLPIAFMYCAGSWGIDDARRRGRPIPLLSRPWFLLFALLTVPAYLIWSRKWWGVACLLFDGCIYLTAGIVGQIVGRYVVYGVAG